MSRNWVTGLSIRLSSNLLVIGAILVSLINLDSVQGEDISNTDEIKKKRKGFLYEYNHDGQIMTKDFAPFWVQSENLEAEIFETNILYPLYTKNQFGEESRTQILQLLSWTTTGATQNDDDNSKGFTLFPIYFSRDPSSTTSGYKAFVPIYGTLENRLFKDRIEFVLFPAYAKTLKKDYQTWNFAYPFFHRRKGENVSGWGAWPILGRESKQPHETMNSWNEKVPVNGYEKGFFLWPFGFWETKKDLETDYSEEFAFLPFYRSLRSAERDSTSILWPFFTFTDDSKESYKELGIPWPFIVFARGEGKQLNRIWPFYSYGKKGVVQSGFLLWPLLHRKVVDASPFFRQRDRFLFFLYSDTKILNQESGEEDRRKAFWPLYQTRQKSNGLSEFSTLALLEPLFPNDEEFARTWSPLWTIYKSKSNAPEGEREWNVFLNLAHGKKSKTKKSWKFGYGLISHDKDLTQETKTWKVFGIPVFKKKLVSQADEAHNVTDR